MSGLVPVGVNEIVYGSRVLSCDVMKMRQSVNTERVASSRLRSATPGRCAALRMVRRARWAARVGGFFAIHVPMLLRMSTCRVVGCIRIAAAHASMPQDACCLGGIDPASCLLSAARTLSGGCIVATTPFHRPPRAVAMVGGAHVAAAMTPVPGVMKPSARGVTSTAVTVMARRQASRCPRCTLTATTTVWCETFTRSRSIIVPAVPAAAAVAVVPERMQARGEGSKVAPTTNTSAAVMAVAAVDAVARVAGNARGSIVARPKNPAIVARAVAVLQARTVSRAASRLAYEARQHAHVAAYDSRST